MRLSVWTRCIVLILCCPGELQVQRAFLVYVKQSLLQRLGVTAGCWQTASAGPLVLVQLSDLHLSDYNASQYQFFGDRLGDLK